MFALKRADIWEAVRDQGVIFSSLGWRKVAADIGNGSKDWGEETAYWNLAEGSPYKEGDCGWGMTILGQHQLREVILPRILDSGIAEIHRGYGMAEFSQNETSVTVIARDESCAEKTLTADFLVGADGGKSATRKQLGFKLEGHTWPEIIISTDALINVDTPGRTGVNYVIDPVNWGFFCPLERPNKNGPTAYRITIPTMPEKCEPEVFEENIAKKFEIHVPGPRPLKYEVL